MENHQDESITPIEQIAKLLYERVIEDSNAHHSPVRTFANEHYENQWWHAASDEEIAEQLKLQEMIEDYWTERN